MKLKLENDCIKKEEKSVVKKKSNYFSESSEIQKKQIGKLYNYIIAFTNVYEKKRKFH